MSIKNSLWTLSATEIAQGYCLDETTDCFHCALCDAFFERGVIYPCGEHYYEAEKMIKHHIKAQHGGTFDYLIALDKQYTGVSPNQKEVLSLMFQGRGDDEIAKLLKVSISTIRNYRFRFKEKERQAKIYSALMQLLREAPKTGDPVLIAPHNHATTIDDRYVITERERNKTLQNNFDEDGRLRVFPRKEKKKIIILTEICKNFKSSQSYTEKEVDRILKRIFDDHVTLRRYLIEYGFLDRNNDGSKYWLK